MIPSKQCRCFLAASMFLLAATTGCGPSGPELGRVEGTVTLDGKPLTGARVCFYPEAGGRTAEAVTDQQGHYVLSYTREGTGAVAGVNKVSISTYEEPVSLDDGTKQGGVPEKVPAKYNTQSTLTREVKTGRQTIDFALESK